MLEAVGRGRVETARPIPTNNVGIRSSRAFAGRYRFHISKYLQRRTSP